MRSNYIVIKYNYDKEVGMAVQKSIQVLVLVPDPQHAREGWYMCVYFTSRADLLPHHVMITASDASYRVAPSNLLLAP